MAFKGLMPAVDLVAPTFGLEAGATVVRHGESDQTWGAGFEQEQGLCGIRGEFWTWCGAGLTPNTYNPATGAGAGGDNPATITDPARSHDLTGDEGESQERWQWVQPFLVQAEDSCGGTLHAKRPETKEHLLEVLEFLSIKAAERELWTGASDPDSKALTRDYDPVGGPGNDPPPKVALALVEDAMAACLPGVQGTIHLTPAIAALLENSLHEEDGKLITFSGSRVIVGAGYAGQTAGGKSAIFGTGPVVAHFGPTSMVTEELAQMMRTTDPDDSNAPHGPRNEFVLRAERLVAVTFDGCCHVGTEVTLT